MAQVWGPRAALIEGHLPLVCLVTGHTAGVTMRARNVKWAVSASSRGTSTVGPGAVVSTSVQPAHSLAALIPLTDAGLRRLQSVQVITVLTVVLCVGAALRVGASFNDLGACVGVGVLAVIASIGFGVFYGARNDVALLERRGDLVLLDVPSQHAVAAIAAQFAQREPVSTGSP